MVVMTPRVVDISHWETIDPDGFKKAVDQGIWAIICKCSQGSGATAYKDPTYDKYSKGARDAGLLVGAYHFGDGTDPKAQVDHFISKANLGPDVLPCLDFEDYPKSNMSINGMVVWLRYFEQKMGKKAVLYSGNRLKDHWDELSSDDKAYVALHLIWLAQYGATPVLPKGLKRVFLHQFTGDGSGPEPHTLDGIRNVGGGGLDLNAYSGTKEELSAEWLYKALPITTTSTPQVQVPSTPNVPSPGNSATGQGNQPGPKGPSAGSQTQGTNTQSPPDLEKVLRDAQDKLRTPASPAPTVLDNIFSSIKAWWG